MQLEGGIDADSRWNQDSGVQIHIEVHGPVRPLPIRRSAETFNKGIEMKALSIRAPWWWFILHGGKDIENRDWSTSYRGRILIHASKWFNLHEIGIDSETAVRIAREYNSKHIGNGYTFRQLKDSGGCLVGSVEIVDCISCSDSPWFFGKYGFVLRNPIAFEPVPFKGALGFFDVPGLEGMNALAAEKGESNE